MTKRVTPEQAEQLRHISDLSSLEKFCLLAYYHSTDENKPKQITAYRLSRPKPSQANDDAIYVQSNRWINLKKCQAYLNQLKDETIKQKKEFLNSDEIKSTEARTKDELVLLLNKQITLAEEEGDTKLINDLTKTLTSLQQLNKEQETDDKKLIHYYLPLRCSVCELYKQAKTNKKTA